MIDVEIVGGPYDGTIYRVNVSANKVRAVEPSPPQRAYRLEADKIGLTVNIATIPIRLTKLGYRAYWNERRISGC